MHSMYNRVMTSEHSTPPPELTVAVSPLLLAGRSPAAMSSLLLADKVVTFLPSSLLGSLEDVEVLKAQYPSSFDAVARMMWSTPMVHAGVIDASVAGEPCHKYLGAMLNWAQTEPSLRELHEDLASKLSESSHGFWELYCKNLAGGNGHPMAFMAVESALGYFALRHKLVVAHDRVLPLAIDPTMSWRQGDLATEFFRYTVPVLRNATAEQILAARDILADELNPFRMELLRLEALAADGSPREIQSLVATHLLPKLDEYRRAFMSRRSLFLSAQEGLEKDAAVAAVALGTALVGGAPLWASSLGAAATALATFGLRYRQMGLKADQSQRETTLGFLCEFERPRKS